MRPVTTAILLVIAFVLGGVIWWIDRDSAGGSGGGGANTNVLVRFDPEEIGRITIKQTREETRLEVSEGSWKLSAPIEDRADPGAVRALIDLLGHLTILDEIGESELNSSDEMSLPALGLTSDQAVRIELNPAEGDGETREVLIGNPTPVANTVYAQIPGGKEVYVVDGNPRKYLENPVTELRDPHLIRLQGERIVQIVLKTPLGDIDVRRKITPPVSDWTLFRPLQTRANRDLVEQVLTGLAALRFENVGDSDGLPGPPPNPIPEGSLAVEVTVFGEEKPVTVFLQPASEGAAGVTLLRARVSDRPAVFQVRSDLLASIPDTPDRFRDPHLARIPPQIVFAVDIESRGNAPVKLKRGKTQRGGSRWFSVRNERDEFANETRIAELFKAVNETPVLEFVSDSAARLEEFNLKPPAKKVIFSYYERQPETAPDGSPAADAGQLAVNQRVLQLSYSDDAGALFANFEGEPYIYEIGTAFWQKARSDPLEWKDLSVIRFNALNLREIVRSRKGEPDLRLVYEFRLDNWKVYEGENDEDLSPRLEKMAAARLRDTLGSLSAIDWTTSAAAFQVLQDPAVSFKIRIQEIDRATGQAKEVEHVLRFAPAAEGSSIYYGSIDESGDLFQIEKEVYLDLVSPLMGRQITPPN